MNQLVAEILITCIILSLIICCIPLYRQSMEMLGSLASLSLAENQFPTFLPDTQAYGADVISLIDYYAENEAVSIVLDSSYGQKTYIDTTYEENPYTYPFTLEQRFLMDVTYESKKVTSIHFILQED
ncbi:hypothetical protein JR334_11675 [Clostridia bacterium]|nr:hypothetical protein JR334_11675 [Clostridia bacterium]